MMTVRGGDLFQESPIGKAAVHTDHQFALGLSLIQALAQGAEALVTHRVNVGLSFKRFVVLPFQLGGVPARFGG